MSYYTLADIERMGPVGCLKHMNELHETNSRLRDEIEQLSAKPITDPTFICEECGRETHVRMNGACVECVEREWSLTASDELAQSYDEPEL